MSLLSKLKLDGEINEENSEENSELFSMDPQPGEKPPRRSSGTKKASPPALKKPPPSTARMAKEVSEDLATFIQMGAAVWGLRDECCAPVLEEQAQPIANALVGILAKNPRMLAKFANADIVSYTLQFMTLGRALLPVGQAFYRNHVSGAVHDGENNRDGHVDLNNFPAFSGSFTA